MRKRNRKFYRITEQDFRDRITKMGREGFIIPETKFISAGTKTKFRCSKHGVFIATPYCLMIGKYACWQCSNEMLHLGNASSQEQYIDLCRKTHGDFYDYSKVKYTGYRDKVEIICPNHGSFFQRANSHAPQGNGCPECFKVRKKSNTEEYISRCISRYGDMYDYSKTVYTRGIDKLIMTCKKHGDFEIRARDHLHYGRGCQSCYGSAGEVMCMEFFRKVGLLYKKEYSIPGSRYRYDFFLPDLNILVEYHGQQHFHIVPVFDDKDGFEDRIARDKAKIELADVHGIDLLVVDYRDFESKRIWNEIYDKISKHRKCTYVSRNGLQYFSTRQELNLRYPDAKLLADEDLDPYLRKKYKLTSISDHMAKKVGPYL